MRVGALKGRTRIPGLQELELQVDVTTGVRKSKCPSQLGRFFSPKPLIAQLRFFLLQGDNKNPELPQLESCGLSNEEENLKGREKA